MSELHPIAFTWADAWLLQSVLVSAGDGTATLGEVVAAGDALNHAIFTYAEMNGGIARLMAGGYVTFARNCLAPTEAARELAASLETRNLSIHRQREEFAKRLGAAPWSSHYDPGNQDAQWTTEALTQDSFAQACSSYHNKSRQYLRGKKRQL